MSVKSSNCLICDLNFTGVTPSSATRKLHTHIKSAHGYNDISQYYLDNVYGGKRPLCACGCGFETGFRKSVFLKYYLDHKNTMPVTLENKIKISNAFKLKAKHGYLKLGITLDDLERYWKLYCKPENTTNEIQKISGSDFRTICKYWLLNGITDKKGLTRMKKLHKAVFSNQGSKNGQYIAIDDNLLDTIVDYVYKCKMANRKVTLNFVRSKFKLNVSNYVLRDRLVDKFGKKCLELFNSGLSSQEEVNFLFVLRHFFGQNNVKSTFKLQGKFYDIVINDKLIIEYDGSYWHKDSAENDKEKDEIAIANGYAIYRVSDTDCNNIDVLYDIKRIIDEIQINKN